MPVPAILLCLLLFASAAIGEGTGENWRFPATNRARTAPAWIPASEALDPGTSAFKRSAFAPGEIESLMDVPPSDGEVPDCPTLRGEPACGHYKRTDSLFALVSNSVAIPVGEIVGIEEGFHFGQAGILLEVRLSPESRLSDAARPVDGILYVHFPWARFALAGRSYCTVAIGHPRPPAVGDRIVAFLYLDPFERSGHLVSPGSREVAFTSGDGLSLPRQIVDDPLLIGVEDFDVLLDRIRSLQMPRAADAASD